MKKELVIIALCLATVAGAQQRDSLVVMDYNSKLNPDFPGNDALKKMSDRKLKIKPLLISATLVTYGFISLENDGLLNLNQELKEEVWTEHPHQLKHIDNYLQFAPAFFVFGLNAIGIKGKNNLRDISMIYLLSNIMLNTTVSSIKKISHQLRPDGSDYYSFPSGHTTEAFASAEFLYQEYKDVSPWYGIAGYTMAATTGYLRMYNNKHWLGDIVAGAGIGIASVKIAYWLYPKIKAALFKDKFPHTAILPSYYNKSIGLSLTHWF